MENYTKFALKPWGDLAALLEDKDRFCIVACNKCFKAFETMEEPECQKVIALAEGLDKTVTGVIKADFLCNKHHTSKDLQLPETLVQAGVDPRDVWGATKEIVETTMDDPCCKTNPMPVEGFVVRRILEEVTGRV